MKVAVGLRRVAAGKRTSGRRAAQIADSCIFDFSLLNENIRQVIKSCTSVSFLQYAPTVLRINLLQHTEIYMAHEHFT